MVVLDILTFLSGILLVTIGVLVLLRQPKSIVHQAFAIFSSFCGLWALSLFFYAHPILFDPTKWLRFVYIVVHLLVLSFLFFAYSFPFITKRHKLITKLIGLFYLFATPLHFYIFFFTDLVLVDVTRQNGEMLAQMGPLYLFYGIYWGILFPYSIYILFRKFQEAKGLPKHQLRIIGLALFIISFPIFFMDIIFPVAFGNTEFYSRSPILTVILVGAIAYTILKHRLFGIRFVLGKCIYIILTLIISLSFFYTVYFILLITWRNILSLGAFLSSIALSLIYILLYWKFDRYLLSLLEKKLIYSKYNPSVLINKLHKISTTQEPLNRIVTDILSIIRQSLKCKRSGVIIFDKRLKDIRFSKLFGFEHDLLKDASNILQSFNFIQSQQVQRYPMSFVYEEILLRGKEASENKPEHIKKIINFMKKNKIAVSLPLKRETRLTGLMLIGHKENLETFTVQDIDLLENIVENASATITRFISSSVLYSDVNEALRNFSSPNLSKYSRLLQLKQIQNLVKKKNISEVEALKEVLSSSIAYFSPKSNHQKRTVSRLRYEILKMIAFEQATESQIMWDLGFDVYTRSVEEKISQQREPRFKLKDASEYSATSDRSFKRLKKEAVEMLRWKLEEGEK